VSVPLPAPAFDPPTPHALNEPPGNFALAETQIELPKTWPDHSQLRLFWNLFRAPFVKSGSIALPEGLPGPEIPEYALKPFHGLPNGYYSHRVADGYDLGFELSMLGRVKVGRTRMVEAMCSGGLPRRCLDVGCGSGRLAHALVKRGAHEVWGVDASPYMLQIAQRRTPEANFSQALFEDTRFENESFDAVGACFLFHEVPSDVLSSGLRELHRIMRPGARLTVLDPGPSHYRPPSLWKLPFTEGPLSLYFHLLSRRVYEPYIEDWHSIQDHASWLEEHGFRLEEKDSGVPFLFLNATRI